MKIGHRRSTAMTSGVRASMVNVMFARRKLIDCGAIMAVILATAVVGAASQEPELGSARVVFQVLL